MSSKCSNSSKGKKLTQKFDTIFSSWDISMLTWKVLIHSIWISDLKAITNDCFAIGYDILKNNINDFFCTQFS